MRVAITFLALVVLALPAEARPVAQPQLGAGAGQVLRPQDIASKCFRSVVLIVCDSGGDDVSQGSGFFVAPGLVVTNYHVIDGSTRGAVRVATDGAPLWDISEVVAYDKNLDLALLRVPGAAGVPALTLAGSSPQTGEKIYALGNPEGLSGSLSDGLVSNARRTDGTRTLIQISAPISHGSSGGPVVNDRGQVIGVAVGFLADGQNLNFAIPAADVRALLKRPTPGSSVVAGRAAGSWRVPVGLAPAPAARAQSIIGPLRAGERPEEASLRGLPGIQVVVEEIDPESAPYVPTRSEIQTRIELELRRYTVKVLTEDESAKTPGQPYLYVNVNLMLNDSVGFIAYATQVQLRQMATPDRDPSWPVPLWVTTWKTGGIATVGLRNARDNVMKNVMGFTDEFINVFLKAQ